MGFGIYLEAQPTTLCNGSFLNYCYNQTTQYGSPAALGVIILGLLLIIIAVFFLAYERSGETRGGAATYVREKIFRGSACERNADLMVS